MIGIDQTATEHINRIINSRDVAEVKIVGGKVVVVSVGRKVKCKADGMEYQMPKEEIWQLSRPEDRVNIDYTLTTASN